MAVWRRADSAGLGTCIEHGRVAVPVYADDDAVSDCNDVGRARDVLDQRQLAKISPFLVPLDLPRVATVTNTRALPFPVDLHPPVQQPHTSFRWS